jgi:hypothetical protein
MESLTAYIPAQERLHDLSSEQIRLSKLVVDLQKARQEVEGQRDQMSEELVSVRADRCEELRRHEEEVRLLTERVERLAQVSHSRSLGMY